MKRKVLGKGIAAIIANEPLGKNRLVDLDVDSIHPNPFQPRKAFAKNALQQLADSMREDGVIQPVVVYKRDGKYLLVVGERRWRAAQLLKWEKIPAVIKEFSDSDVMAKALIENIQREDLSAIEAAEAYQQLSEEFELSHEEIAIRVGKSRTAVTNTMRLLKLPPEVVNAIMEGKISEGHGRALLGLENPAAQIAAMKSVLSNDFNVRQTEDLVRKLAERKSPTPAPKKEIPAEITAFEKQLRSQYGTKVSIHHGKQGGSLTFYYYSEEELENLIEQMLQS